MIIIINKQTCVEQNNMYAKFALHHNSFDRFFSVCYILVIIVDSNIVIVMLSDKSTVIIKIMLSWQKKW